MHQAIFRIDELAIAAPVGRSLGGRVGSQHDRPPELTDETTQERFRAGGIKQVADEDPQGTGAQRHLDEIWGGRGIRRGQVAGEIGPSVTDHGAALDHFPARALQQGQRSGGSRLLRGGVGEITQLDDPSCFFLVGEHRFRDIEEDFDDGPHLLAIEFQRIIARSGVGLPVDVTRVVPGHVVPMILEIERAAHS